MEPKIPPGVRPGQRSLAAIVFTDVVSFSARMQTDEELTLRILKRDFEAMRKICAEHHGAVLKTTGDGLLLYFTSAVQAVACALATQRYFAGLAKSQPAAETLTHRVGVHLGDVFVNDQDVMGDGVNIAARLQAEAHPGGICISQTVYDVVKNKLELHVTRLGPRELKNISQVIPIYRLLLEAQTMGAAEAALSPPPQALPKKQHLAAAQVLALAVVVVVLALLVWRSFREQQQERDRAELVQTAVRARLQVDSNATGDYNRIKMTGVLVEWRDELRDNRSRAPEKYNFSELADSLRETRGGPVAQTDAPLRRLAVERMQALFGWLVTDLQRYNKQNPLAVPELSGTAPKEIKVFVGADRQLYYAGSGAIRQRNWSDLPPATFGAIIVGALLHAASVPPREILEGVEIFGFFYHLPEMNETLRQGYQPRVKK